MFFALQPGLHESGSVAQVQGLQIIITSMPRVPPSASPRVLFRRLLRGLICEKYFHLSVESENQ
jgi:hypothetical protein